MNTNGDWFKVKMMLKLAIALYILYAKVSFYNLMCNVFKKEFPERVEGKFMDASASVGGSVDEEIWRTVEEGAGWKVQKLNK